MKALGAIIIFALLISLVVGFQAVEIAKANPYRYIIKGVPPPENAVPLAISILSPAINGIYSANNITVNFNVTIFGTSMCQIYSVYLKASWMQENITVFKQNPASPEFPQTCTYNEVLSAPEGNQSIVIAAYGRGSYTDNIKVDYFDGTIYNFDMTSISVVNFTSSPSTIIPNLSATPNPIQTFFPSSTNYPSKQTTASPTQQPTTAPTETIKPSPPPPILDGSNPDLFLLEIVGIITIIGVLIGIAYIKEIKKQKQSG